MILRRLLHGLRAAVRRAVRNVLAGCIVAMLVAIAFGFGTAALYMALAARIGALFACLAVGGIYLVVALFVLLVARVAGPPPADLPGPPDRGGLEQDAVIDLIATFLAGVRAGREGFGRKRK